MMRNGCQSIGFVDFTTNSNIKQIFMQQQASHIDDNGNFLLISSLHRSIVANKLEVMNKLQKKVNQACISTKDQHAIGCR